MSPRHIAQRTFNNICKRIQSAITQHRFGDARGLLAQARQICWQSTDQMTGLLSLEGSLLFAEERYVEAVAKHKAAEQVWNDLQEASQPVNKQLRARNDAELQKALNAQNHSAGSTSG